MDFNATSSIASTLEALDAHVATPHLPGTTITCTTPIPNSTGQSSFHSYSFHTSNTSANHHDGPPSPSPTLPRLRLTTVFTFPPPSKFQLQHSQPRRTTFWSVGSSGLPDTSHVPHPPSKLATAHSNSSSCSPSHHFDTMVGTYYTHPNGQP